MPYIGKQPLGGAYNKLDALTASATDTYALTLGSAAYYPGTANQLLVSLNGVIQAPQDSFTVSGSNLVFDSALTASDSIDFVVALGDVLDINTPSDGAITTAKIANQAVTMDKLATSGTLPALNGSALTGISVGKILQVVQSSVTAKQSLTITANVYQDTNLTLNITPSATTSKILVIANLVHGNTGANQPTYVRVARTLSGTQTAITAKLQHFSYASNAESNTGSANCTKLDNPQTTSQLTYTAQISRTNNGTAHFNGNYYQDGFESFLTAIEIGA